MDTRTTTKQLRKSLYLGEGIRAFLRGGAVKGRSESKRVDILALRYDFLIREAFPRRMQVTAPELVVLSRIIQEWSVEEPADAAVLATRVEQLANTGSDESGVDLRSFASRLRLGKPAELVALVHAAEVVVATLRDGLADGDQSPLDIARQVLDTLEQSV